MPTSRSSKTAARQWARWTPTGAHYQAPGIPGRDLSPDEVDAYGPATLLRAKCYTLVSVEDEPWPGDAPVPTKEAEPQPAKEE